MWAALTKKAFDAVGSTAIDKAGTKTSSANPLNSNLNSRSGPARGGSTGNFSVTGGARGMSMPMVLGLGLVLVLVLKVGAK